MSTIRSVLAPVLASVLTLLDGCSGRTPEAPAPPIRTWPRSVAVPLHATSDAYTAPVTIGAQTFALTVDTGSSTLVVAGSDCSDCVGVAPLYTPGPTAMATGDTTDGSYADLSEWHGIIYDDQIVLGVSAPPLPLRFAALTSHFGDFLDDESEGFIGMGPSGLTDGDTTAYAPVAAASSADEVLTFELCADGGTMWIGDYDHGASASPRFTPLFPVDEQHRYYQIAVDDFGLGGVSLGFGSAAFHDPVVDTGSTDLILPTAIEGAFRAAVNASPGVTALFPGQQLTGSDQSCFTAPTVTAAQVDAAFAPMTTTLPDGTGGTFTVSAPATRSYLVDQGGGRYCYAVADAQDGTLTVLGDAFLRGFISVLDVPGHRFGLAPDTGCAAARTPSVRHAFGHRRPRS